MNISDDTIKVLEFLDSYSEGGIRKSNDIASLLEIGAQFNQFDLFNSITFLGTSVWNLSKKIKNLRQNTEGIYLLNKEFNTQIDQLQIALKNLINFANDEIIIDRFDTIYFINTQGSIKNLIDLSHDLSIIKDIQSQAKRK